MRKLTIYVALLVLVHGCIEAFDVTFVDFQSALVIEATITNENKQQRINLTRTYEFEEDGPTPESGAMVSVSDSNGNTYVFNDEGEGVYVSSQSFAAQTGITYRLSIVTQNGRRYSSDAATLSPGTGIDEINAERIINDDGEEGVAILVNSFDPTGQSQNYRYEYEETYRVIAPFWRPISLAGDPEGGCGVIKVPNQEFEEVCYPTMVSNDIILTSTTDLQEDRVDQFMVRFLNRNNYIISHRYTILVRQFVQSDEAFTFFSRLDELSSSQSLFSQIQPGFLQGNVFSEDNREEQVLGFFDVTTVSEQRIFFNYNDLFPGEDLPPYVEPCVISAPVLQRGVPPSCVLRNLVEGGLVTYVDDNQGGANEGPFEVVPSVCGDCRILGTTEIPDFWLE